MSAIKKLKDFILTKLSADEQKELNDFKAPAQPVKLAQINTQDGTMILSFDGDALAVGSAIMDVTSGTPMPVADGTYTLADGSSITVASGVVTVLTPVAAAATPPAAPSAAQMVATQMAAHKAAQAKEISELKLSNEKLTSQLMLLNKVVKEILEAPITNKEPEKEVDLTGLKGLEKRRAFKNA